MKNSYRTWIEISASAFNHNITQIKRLVHTPIGVVVKADAYGHGLEAVGRLCQENDNVSWLFVASVDEGLALRHHGITKPILVMAFIEPFVDAGLTYAVADIENAQRLNQHSSPVAVHIKIDTGMSRLGFEHATFAQQLPALMALKNISIQGIFTHLADTNNSDYSFTQMQVHRFKEAAALLERALERRIIKHVLSSGALHMSEQFDCVRVGTNVYGNWKSAVQKQRLTALQPALTLQPVLTWKTRVMQIKQIQAGDAVGYHCAFVAPTTMKIAVLPVGYYDGYSRALSHKAQVLIRQVYAPIIGIISMNMMVADVTHIGSVQVNDPVILCGDYPGITAHDLALMADSLHNEFLSRISPTIPRMVV